MVEKKYSKYISIDNWIKVLPSHWTVERVKDNFDQVSVKGSELKPQTYIPLENIESFTGKLLTTSSNENGEETILFKKGDLLFMKLRPYLAKVLLADFDGGVSGEVIVNRVKTEKADQIINRYFFYKFLSSQFISKVNSMTDGVKMPRANPSKISALEITIPPVIEQKRIAAYLDKKTFAIDKKISLLESKITDYKELSKSFINEAVCLGLNRKVQLTESNLSWIRKIPKHWEINRMKDIYEIRKNLVGESSANYQLLSLTQNGVIVRDLEKNAGKFPAEFNSYQIVKPDDLIFCLFDLDVTPRTVGISNNHGMITGAYTILVSKSEKIYTKYYYYLYLMLDNSKKLSLFYTGLRNTIKKETFLSLPVIVPPLNEQVAIADYLDSKTQTIDASIKNIATQIKLLKELRKALINDAVTGNMKVN
jgi:type I restriction enzyme S subunit